MAHHLVTSAEKLRVRYSSLFHNIYSSLAPVVNTEKKRMFPVNFL